MTGADAALAAFAVFNVVRIAAYLPQILKIRADIHGAAAISVTTWAMFAASHASTALYALFTTADLTLACVFAMNTACCLSIVILTLVQRHRYRTGRCDGLAGRGQRWASTRRAG